MEQDLQSIPFEKRTPELEHRLRQHERPKVSTVLPATLKDMMESWCPKWLYAVLSWAVQSIFSGMRLTTLFSGRCRWFMQQHYLAPQQSGTFVGFAERLTVGARKLECAEELDKLLVHAFLEDLRSAYRGGFWRPSGRRRTANPAVLIDNALDDEVTYRFIRLINDVRNETGLPDPLVVLAASGSEPPESTLSMGRPTAPLEDVQASYKAWRELVPEARRARDPAAWLLPIAVPSSLSAEQISEVPADLAPPTPAFYTHGAWLALASLVVGAAIVGVLLLHRWGWEFECWPRSAGGLWSVRRIDAECIGFSDGSSLRFNSEQRKLSEVQTKLFVQNELSRETWERSGRRRPYFTLVYLGTLSGRRTRSGEEAYVSEVEELEGVLAAQRAGTEQPADATGSALLRIVVANGGDEMRHATEAVRMLADTDGGDAPILGVIGLVESRTSTEDALRALNQAQILAIAPTLSADGLYKSSKLYLQIAPPNEDQVRMVREYAAHLGLSHVDVYYNATDSYRVQAGDLYISTLLDNSRRLFASPLTHEIVPWKPKSGAIKCRDDHLAFYAGRWLAFGQFFEEFADCGTSQVLVADDSVNRYMADEQRREIAFARPLTFVSKAALATCFSLSAAINRNPEAGRFLRLIREDGLLLRKRCLPDSKGVTQPVGERVGLAYDATTMLVKGVESLAARLRSGDDEQWETYSRSISSLTLHTEVLRRWGVERVGNTSVCVPAEPSIRSPQTESGP
jgi:hypothetical protein